MHLQHVGHVRHVLFYLLVYVVEVFFLRVLKVEVQVLDVIQVFYQLLAPVTRYVLVFSRSDDHKQLVDHNSFQLLLENDLREELWDKREVRHHLASKFLNCIS